MTFRYSWGSVKQDLWMRDLIVYVERNKNKHYKVSFTFKKKSCKMGTQIFASQNQNCWFTSKTLSKYVSDCPGRTSSKTEDLEPQVCGSGKRGCFGWGHVELWGKPWWHPCTMSFSVTEWIARRLPCSGPHSPQVPQPLNPENPYYIQVNCSAQYRMGSTHSHGTKTFIS